MLYEVDMVWSSNFTTKLLITIFIITMDVCLFALQHRVIDPRSSTAAKVNNTVLYWCMEVYTCEYMGAHSSCTFITTSLYGVLSASYLNVVKQEN